MNYIEKIIKKIENYVQLFADEYITYEGNDNDLYRIDSIDNLNRVYISLILDRNAAKQIYYHLGKYLNKQEDFEGYL